MEDALAQAKSLIDEQVFISHIMESTTKDKVYGLTNENITGFINSIGFRGKDSALSVLASGDQVFSFISKGIKNIDTFDINILTKYVALGFKRALILSFSYEEYLQVFKKLLNPKTSLDELTAITYTLTINMDEEYRKFWQELLAYNYKLQKSYQTSLNLFGMIFLNTSFNEFTIKRCPYLLDEEAYNQLKNNLAHANISFKNINAINLTNYFASHYDILYLSNITDYLFLYYGWNFDYTKFNELKEKWLELLQKDGILLFYIFSCYKKRFKNYSKYPIKGSRITISDLSQDDIMLLPKITEVGVDNLGIKDALVLARNVK